MMKMFSSLTFYQLLLIGSLTLAMSGRNTEGAPLGTEFTYQGQLNQGSGPAAGTFDFEFRLYDRPDVNTAALLGTNKLCAVPVSQQLFTVELDFGAVFDGNARWLEVGVVKAGPCDGTTVFTRLSPLQSITAVPYALFALSGNGSQGPEGPQGPEGMIGPGGLNCWDLNGNNAQDLPDEDLNGDGNVDVLDCKGPKGDPDNLILTPIAARAIGAGLLNFSTPGVRRNDYIDIEIFDIGDGLQVADGPIFMAPATGLYLVNYRQVFRNPTNEGVDIPAHWQYGILLKINGVNDLTYYSVISNINRSADYVPVEVTDIVQLNAGDTIEAMESLDPVQGGTLQKFAASFSMALLHCLDPTGCD